MMRKRASLNKHLTRVCNEERKQTIMTKVNDIEQKIKMSHESQRSAEENQAIKNIKQNPKYFFSYCKRYSKTKSNIGPLRNPKGMLTQDPQETSQLLAQQYSGSFNAPYKQKIIINPDSFFYKIGNQKNVLADFHINEKDKEGHKRTKAQCSCRTRWCTGNFTLKMC